MMGGAFQGASFRRRIPPRLRRSADDHLSPSSGERVHVATNCAPAFRVPRETRPRFLQRRDAADDVDMGICMGLRVKEPPRRPALARREQTQRPISSWSKDGQGMMSHEWRRDDVRPPAGCPPRIELHWPPSFRCPGALRAIQRPARSSWK
jgi:hypothetical protein